MPNIILYQGETSPSDVRLRDPTKSVDVVLANDVESASQVSTPAIAQVHVLLADDVQSTSNVTVPALHQVHALLANDVESASQLATPAVGQVHALLANDVQSGSEVGAPALAEVSTTDALLANDVESASEVTTPPLGQVHVLLAVSVESASTVSIPALGGLSLDTAGDVATAAEIAALEAAGKRVRAARDRSVREKREADRRLAELVAKTYRRIVEQLPDVAEEISTAVAPEATVTPGKPVSVVAFREAMVGRTERVADQVIVQLREWQDREAATVAQAALAERIALQVEKMRADAEMAADEDDVEMLLLIN